MLRPTVETGSNPVRVIRGRMTQLKCLALFLCVFVACSAWGQELAKRLTNESVIEMVGLGLSDDVIITKIRADSAAGTTKFDTSVEGLKALKAGNVSDAVIKAIINPAPPPAPIVAATTPMTLDPN